MGVRSHEILGQAIETVRERGGLLGPRGGAGAGQDHGHGHRGNDHADHGLPVADGQETLLSSSFPKNLAKHPHIKSHNVHSPSLRRPEATAKPGKQSLPRRCDIEFLCVHDRLASLTWTSGCWGRRRTRWSAGTGGTARCRRRSIGYGRGAGSRGGWPWTCSGSARETAETRRPTPSTRHGRREEEGPVSLLQCRFSSHFSASGVSLCAKTFGH